MPATQHHSLRDTFLGAIESWFMLDDDMLSEYTSSLLAKDHTLAPEIAGLLLVAVHTPYEVSSTVIDDKRASLSPECCEALVRLSQLATNHPINVGLESGEPVPAATHWFRQVSGGEQAYRPLHPLVRAEMRRQAKAFIESMTLSPEATDVKLVLNEAFEIGANMVEDKLARSPVTIDRKANLWTIFNTASTNDDKNRVQPTREQQLVALEHAYHIEDIAKLHDFVKVNPPLTIGNTLALLNAKHLDMLMLPNYLDSILIVLIFLHSRVDCTLAQAVEYVLTKYLGDTCSEDTTTSFKLCLEGIMTKVSRQNWIKPFMRWFNPEFNPYKFNNNDQNALKALIINLDDRDKAAIFDFMSNLQAPSSAILSISMGHDFVWAVAKLARSIDHLPSRIKEQIWLIVKYIVEKIPAATGSNYEEGFVSGIAWSHTQSSIEKLPKYIALAEQDGCLNEWLKLLETTLNQTVNQLDDLPVHFKTLLGRIRVAELGFELWRRCLTFDLPLDWLEWILERQLSRALWLLEDGDPFAQFIERNKPPRHFHPVFRVVQAVMDTGWEIKCKLEAVKRLLSSQTALNFLAQDQTSIGRLIARIRNSTHPTVCLYWLLLSPDLLAVIDYQEVAVALAMAETPSALSDHVTEFGQHFIPSAMQSALDTIQRIPSDTRLAQAFTQLNNLFGDKPVRHDIGHIVACAQCLVGVKVIGVNTHPDEDRSREQTASSSYFFSIFGATSQPVLEHDLLTALWQSTLSSQHQIAVLKALLETNTQSTMRGTQTSFQALSAKLIIRAVDGDQLINIIQNLVTVSDNKNDNDIRTTLSELDNLVETTNAQSGDIAQALKNKLDAMLSQHTHSSSSWYQQQIA